MKKARFEIKGNLPDQAYRAVARLLLDVAKKEEASK